MTGTQSRTAGALALAVFVSVLVVVGIAALGGTVAAQASGDTIHVDDDWSENSSGDTVGDGYVIGDNATATITDALDNATSSDTIVVHDGNYTEQAVVDKKNIVLEAQNDSGATIWYEPGSVTGEPTVKVTANGSTVSGFDVVRVAAPERNSDAAFPTQFTQGVRVSASDVNVTDNVVTGSGFGDGVNNKGIMVIDDESGDATGETVQKVTITGNDVSGFAAPLSFTAYYSGNVTDVTFSGNTLSGYLSNGISVGEQDGAVDVELDGYDYEVTTDDYPGTTVYFENETDALAFGNSVSGAVVTDANGDLVVGSGMSIQDAVNASSDGNTIELGAGTYTEQVVIESNVTLVGSGEGQTVIQSPASLDEKFSTDLTSFNANETNYPVVYVNESTVDISHLTVDGLHNGNDNYRFHGIAYRNSLGTVSNVTVTNTTDLPFSGSQHGFAVAFYNTDGVERTVTLKDSTLRNYQKNGFVASGPGLAARVIDNVVIGKGPTDVIGQNGIEFIGEASGTARDNHVSDHYYTPTSNEATNVILFGHSSSETTVIKDNTLVDGEVGVGVALSSNVDITGNNFTNSDWHVYDEPADTVGLDTDAIFKNNGFDAATYAGNKSDTNGEHIFSSVQDAIDASDPGDTVTVAPGTYSGQVVVNKSIDLVAPDGATIAYTPAGHSGQATVKVSANNSSVSGFTVERTAGPDRGQKSWIPFTQGIRISASNVTVENNTVTGTDLDYGRSAGIMVLDDETNGTPTGETVTNVSATDNDVSGFTTPFSAFEAYGGSIDDVTFDANSVSGNDFDAVLVSGANFTAPGYDVVLRNASGNYYFQSESAALAATSHISATTIENTTSGDFLVGDGMSIQTAVDAADPGDTIQVGSGTFHERNVVLDKPVTIIGDGMESTVVDAQNSSTAGNQHVFVVRSNQTTIEGLTMTDGHDAIRISQGAHVEDFTLRNTRVNISNIGMYVAGNAVDSANGEFDDVLFENTHWTNNQRKAIYVEKLSNATFDQLYVDGVTGPDYGFMNGIDINLKGGDYSNITIENSVVRNVAKGTPYDGTNAFSSAISVKGRDDSSYSGNPGHLDDLTIDNVTVEDSFNGLRLGEPGKSISSPENVDITDSTFENNTGYHFQDVTATPISGGAVYQTDSNEFSSGVFRPTGSTVWANVQSGLDRVQNGDTLLVQSGTYEESVTVSTENVTLAGQNNPTIVGDGVGEGDRPHAAIHLDSSNGDPLRDVTVLGFTIQNPNGTYGIYAGSGGSGANVTGLLVESNTIEQIGTQLEASDTGSWSSSDPPLAGSVSGVYVRSDYDGIVIANNEIGDVSAPSGTPGRATGIGLSSFIGTKPAFADGEYANGTVVVQNTIEGISSPARTKGIAASGEFDGMTIAGNEITDVDGADERALGITLTENPDGGDIDGDGDGERVGPRNFTVVNNSVTQINASSPSALFVGGYEDLGSGNLVTDNTLIGPVERFHGAQAGFTLADADVLQAPNNFWGVADGPSGVAPGSGSPISDMIDYRPFYETASGDVNQDGVTFYVNATAAAPANGSQTAPFPTIEDALNASMPGDTIVLQDGTYDRSSTLTLDQNGVTIQGESRDGVVIDASDVSSKGIRTPVGGNVTGLVFENLTVIGPDANYAFKFNPTTDGVELRNLAVTDSGSTGIDFNGVRNVSIEDVTVSNTTGGNGIALADTRHVLVDDVTVENNSWGGIALYTNDDAHPEGLENGTHDVTIVNSQFLNNSGPGVYAQNSNQAQNPFENINVFNNEFADQETHVTELDTNNNIKQTVDWFDFDMVVGANDFDGATLVRTSAGEPAVPAVFSSIQAGETAASPGELVFVESGTYDEFVDIGTNNVTLIGMDGATIAPSDETIANQGNRAWLIDMRGHSNVTINGLAFEGNSTDSLVAVAVNGEDANVWDTSIENVRTGIQTHSKWDLKNNTFGESSSDGALLGNNDIENVEFGISIQSNDAFVVNNTVSDAHSAIAVLNGRHNVQVAENQFSNLNETAVGISDNFEKNGSVVTSGSVAVHENDLTGGTDGVNNTAGVDVNAAFNYWGAADGPSGKADGSGVAVSDNVTFAPYYTDAALTTIATPDSAISTGFTVSDTTPLTSEVVDVDVTVENTGEFEADRTITLIVDGNNVSTQDVQLASGETETLTFQHQFTSAGDHTVTVHDGNLTLSPTTVTADLASNPNAAVNITSPSDGAVFDGDQVTVEYDLSNVDTGIDHATVSVNGGSTQTVPLGQSSATVNLSEGANTVTVSLVNNVGTVVTSDSVTVDSDTTEPVVSIDPARDSAIGENAPVEVDLTVDDANYENTSFFVVLSGSPAYLVYLPDELADGEETITWDGTANDGSALSSGQYALGVGALDQAGNENVTLVNVTVDNDEPTVTEPVVNDTDLGSGDTVEVTVGPTDDETSVDDVTVTLVADDVNFRTSTDAENNSGTWTATFDASELDIDGNYTVNATATDAANNDGVGSNASALDVDTTAPAVSAILDTKNVTHGYVNVTVPDDVTSASAIELNLTGPSGAISVSDLSSVGPNQYSGTFPVVAGSNDYTLEANATDDAGNLGETTASANISTGLVASGGDTISVTGGDGTLVNFTLDSDLTGGQAALTSSGTPLAELGTNVGSTFLNGELNQNLTDALANATIRIPVEGNVPDGVSQSEVNISRYNTTTDQWVEFPTLVVAVDGTDYFETTVDQFSTYGPVAPDNTAPTIDDTELAPTLSGQAFDYGTSTVDVTVEYSDNKQVNASNVTVLWNGDDVTNDAETSISPSETTFTATDLVGSGDHNVTVEVTDTAGNVNSTTVEFTVEPDEAAPTVTDQFADTYAFGTDPVPVEFSLSDPLSGVDTSNVTLKVDGSDETGPAVVTASSVQYDASGLAPGQHTVVLNVTDNAGNNDTVTETFTIESDGSGPTVSDVSFSPTLDDGALPAGTEQATVTIQYSDVESGINASAIEVELDGQAVTNSAVVTASQLEYTVLGLTNGSTQTLTARIHDGEGNVRTRSVTLEVAEPTTSGGGGDGSDGGNTGGGDVGGDDGGLDVPVIGEPVTERLEGTGTATLDLPTESTISTVEVDLQSSGTVDATAIGDLPSDASQPTGETVAVVDIEVSETASDTVTVRLSIPSAAVDDLGASASDLVIEHQNDDGTWTTLDTTVVSQASGQITVEAEATDFSLYAVTAQQQTTPTTEEPDETTTPTPEEPSETTTPTTPSPTDQPETTSPTTTPMDGDGGSGGFDWTMIGLIVLVLVLIGAAVVYLRSQRS